MKRVILCCTLALSGCDTAPLPEIAALQTACEGGDMGACAALPAARQSVMAAYGAAFTPTYLPRPQQPVKVILCDPRFYVC